MAGEPLDIRVLHDLVATPLSSVPRIPELSRIQLQGCRPGSRVRVGSVEVVASEAGYAIVDRLGVTPLDGLVGLIDVEVDGILVGSIEVVPTKMDERTYHALLAELRATWGDLVFDAEGARAARLLDEDLRSPLRLSAAELLERIELPVRSALERPTLEIAVKRAPARVEKVTTSFGLTPSVLRNMALGRPGWSRRLERKASEPPLLLIARTLRLLMRLAADEGDSHTRERCRGLLGHPLVRELDPAHITVTWAIRSEDRFRRILAVHDTLAGTQTTHVLGPKEVVLGVRALPKLFEYWVFLRTLVEVERALGKPESGYAHLARPVRAGRFMLEIQPGSTVRFRGGTLVSYSPEIGRHSGWEGLRLAPHPLLSDGGQKTATPDVVVLHAGEQRSAIVIDAKYVGEHHLDRAAARMHEKYARITHRGTPAVRSVWVAHPHEQFNRWPGYGSFPMKTDEAGFPIAILDELGVAIESPVLESSSAPPPVQWPDAEPKPLLILLDQIWAREVLGDRRIDFAAALAVVAGGRKVRGAIAVFPAIAALDPFDRGLTSAGWRTHRTATASRTSMLNAVISLAKQGVSSGSDVVIISDMADMKSMCASEALTVEWFTDLLAIPAPNDYRIAQPGRAVQATSQVVMVRLDVPRPNPAALTSEEQRFLVKMSIELDGRTMNFDDLVEYLLSSVSFGLIYRDQMVGEGVLLSSFGGLIRALGSTMLALPRREGTLLDSVERVLDERGVDPPLEVFLDPTLSQHVIVMFGSRPR